MTLFLYDIIIIFNNINKEGFYKVNRQESVSFNKKKI